MGRKDIDRNGNDSRNSRPDSNLSNGTATSNNLFKILILGSPQVGKSSLMHSFVYGEADESQTLMADSMEKTVTLDDESADDKKTTVSIIIHNVPDGIDTPHQLKNSFFQDAQGAIFMFSTIDNLSFERIGDWYERLQNVSDGIPVVFVENKIDVIENSVLDQEEVETLAKSHKMRLYRVSTKANHNVQEMFTYLIQKMIRQYANRPTSTTTTKTNEEGRESSWSNVDQDFRKNDSMSPGKRRTDGIKPVFNRHTKSCSLM